MSIIELTEMQFKSYAKIHSRRNYFQTIEFANMYEQRGFKKIYIGLIDKDNNLVAATLLLLSKIKGYKYAYAPRGFLIDYLDTELFTTFTNLLKKYLKKIGIVFVKIDPKIVYKKYDKNNNLIESNENIMNLFKKLDYVHLGFNTYFEAYNSRYEVISNNFSDINDAYSKISRNVKRSLDDNNKMGISIHKGSYENLDLFYSIIRKKTNNDINYYHDLLKYFNTDDNKIELYFAKINPEIYVNNYRYLMQKENEKNFILNEKIKDNNTKKTESLLKKKILSDHLLQEYNNEVVKALQIYRDYPNGLVVGTIAVIKNNREIYFLIDGYVDKLKNVHTSYMLKWEIIKKYLSEGYKLFNLGEITGNFNKENNKYYGLYFSKMGFDGNIYEYPGEFDLVVNKMMYKLYYNVMHYTSKIKDK